MRYIERNHTGNNSIFRVPELLGLKVHLEILLLAWEYLVRNPPPG